tara:strand:- start:279 stop:458 length:180 start_codon:yes stop_codon:yes gene_type:complete
MFKKIIFYSFLIIGCILISCEDDPLLAPQTGEAEDGGSYGNLSIPSDNDKDSSNNPEVF